MVLKFKTMPIDHEAFIRELRDDFVKSPVGAVRMVCLLFARPEVALAKKEIVPHLPYYNRRSGRSINFYCAGYGTDKDSDGQELGKVGESVWFFSDNAFLDTKKYIELDSTWKYSGGTDLIISNAIFESSNRTLMTEDGFEEERLRAVYLDFSTAISLNLERMLADKAITTVPMFFEDIFKFADGFDGTDPTWSFSDSTGAKLAGSALKQVILNLLPKGVRENASKAFHFAVRDISRRSPVRDV